MNMNAFETYVREVITELGTGWTVHRHDTWSRCLVATHTDRRELHLWCQDGGSRMAVNGSYPDTDRAYRGGERPETTAATSRAPGAVAQQIMARVMPQYATTLAAVRAHNERIQQNAAEQGRIARLLRAYIPDEETAPGSLKRPVIALSQAYEHVDGKWEYTDRVVTKIEFSGLDEATATVIMQAYATARAAQGVL